MPSKSCRDLPVCLRQVKWVSRPPSHGAGNAESQEILVSEPSTDLGGLPASSYPVLALSGSDVAAGMEQVWSTLSGADVIREKETDQEHQYAK